MCIYLQLSLISVFTLGNATATVIVDTMELGQPNKMFALSDAAATVNVDTIILCVYIYHYHCQCVYTKRCHCRLCRHYGIWLPNKKHFCTKRCYCNRYVDTIIFCVHINNYHFLRVDTKRCYCNKALLL